MAEQRREYFRVQYPVVDRPVLTAKSYRFEVIDVSEYGVRFRRNDQYAFEPGMQLVAWIRFSDDSEYQCSGEVLRCDQDSVSLQLHTPIPMKRICAESVHLKLNYSDRCEI